MLKIDYSYAHLHGKLEDYNKEVLEAADQLLNHKGLGSEFTDWVEWPDTYDHQEVAKIKEIAKEINEDGEYFLVCGIGGSYLGARSAIEFIQGLYPNRKIKIIYMGNTLSGTYTKQIYDLVKGHSFYLNVVSKSGTTTETAVSFRIFEDLLKKQYPDDYKRRIISTTDKQKGTLKSLSDIQGYRTLVVPDGIGGRYSVISAVGLLPIAVAGIDIDEILRGTHDAMVDLRKLDINTNPAMQYAVLRRMMEKQGKTVETLVTYDMAFASFAEWWKQLYGESEGKDGKGILPDSVVFSTDLHSMGQFIQEGNKILYETVLRIKNPAEDMEVPFDKDNLDNMNYLAGKSLNWINSMATQGTLDAHSIDGNVPNIIIDIDDQTPYTYGYLIYFFFFACGLTCYMVGVNPFNQPGVEVYKKRMFKLLGKE